MTRALAAVLSLSLAVAGCRSVDTELYARTKREMGRFEKGFAKMEGPSTGPLPAPWAPGQFAVWAITTDDETTLIEAQVVYCGPGGATVSVVSLSPRQRTTASISFEHQPKDLADARASLRQITRTRGEGPAFTYRFKPGAVQEDMLEALQPLWGMLVPALGAGEQKTVSTAAATMQGCTPVSAAFVYKHTAIAVQGYAHPAVPISGFLKGKSSEGPENVELMEYGWSGGAPAL
jgi:hypothetical protein